MSIRLNGCSYLVKTENRTYLRGIRFIKADKADNTEQVLIVMSALSKPSRPSCMKAPVGTRRSNKSN